VKKIRVQDGYKIVEMSDGSEVHGKTIIIATGVEYKKLECSGIDDFTGAGVYYGAAAVEAMPAKTAVCTLLVEAMLPARPHCTSASFAKDVAIHYRRDALKTGRCQFSCWQNSL
jgi:thioredoxin reductase (NADPH)